MEAPDDLFLNRAFETGASPFSVASSDLDGDGAADLAVANNGSRDISILRNQGGGMFAEHEEYPLGNGLGDAPSSAILGDLDGDGDADLAVATQTNVTVLINQIVR